MNLHVLEDSIQSMGMMNGGAIIWYRPIDLICTLVFPVIVSGTTTGVLRNIVNSTGYMREMEEVVAVHDELHLWAITLGKSLLPSHVKIKPEADTDMVLDKVIDCIKREYKISHVTIQIERQ